VNLVIAESGSEVKENLPDGLKVINPETAESSSGLKADNSEGFKFAVATIVAFSTIGYNIYIYMVNNPVNSFLFFLSYLLF
jgi:hypothetical protein